MNIDELFKIQSNTLNPVIGDVLIAEPFMNDFYFRRSVILLIDHNDEGSLGVIINKRLTIPFNEIVQGFPEFNADVYLGGPVETDRIFFTHTVGEMIPDSHLISSGLYWSGNINALKAMIKMDLIKPHEVRPYSVLHRYYSYVRYGRGSFDAGVFAGALREPRYLYSAHRGQLHDPRPRRGVCEQERNPPFLC